MGTVYALLAGVGQYDRPDIAPLSCWAGDISWMQEALHKGLNIESEHIRVCGRDGVVTVSCFARSIKEFASMIREDDTFLFYFSGHGNGGNLFFTDQALNFQSVISFLDHLTAKSKILIIDCCEAGAFETAGSRKFSMEDTIETFAGHGYAVLASSSADAPSRIHPEYKVSLYTCFLAKAMMSSFVLDQGRKSLARINELAVRYAKVWSEQHKEYAQYPVYRASLGGTIFFDVEKYVPWQTKEIHFETDLYEVCKVEPVHTANMKRLSVDVILKQKCSEEEIVHFAREIRDRILYADVYPNARLEQLLAGKPARLIKCYIGYDQSDLLHRRFAYVTTWVDEGMDRSHWYSSGKNRMIIGDIHLMKNTSYEIIRKMQNQETTAEEYRQLLKPLMADIISMAEELIALFHEFQNQTISEEELENQYSRRYGKITQLYRRLSDLPMEPDELYSLAEEMYALTGSVHDFALIYSEKNMRERSPENREWLLQSAIKRYYQGLEKMKGLIKDQ